MSLLIEQLMEINMTTRKINLLAAVLVLFGLSTTNFHAQNPSTSTTVTPQMQELIQAQKRVLERFKEIHQKHRQARDSETETDIETASILTEGWNLVARWSTAWLELHPNASSKQLKRIFADFTPVPPDNKTYEDNQPLIYVLEGSATRIAPNVYVVEAAYYNTNGVFGTFGDFFIVSRNSSGHFQRLWEIKPLAAQHFPMKDEIGLWAVT